MRKRVKTKKFLPSVSTLGCFLSVLLIFLLLFNVNHCTRLTANNSNENYAHFRNSSTGTGFFRFRDFEPRLIASSHHANTQKLNGVRKARGIHFQADDKDLNVDLEFIIPFVHIPIERSMQVTTTALRRLVNLNSGTLLFSGALLVMAVIIGGFFKLLSAPTLYGYTKSTRSSDRTTHAMDAFSFVNSASHLHDDNSQSASVIKVDDLLQMLELKLLENHINVSACAQKSICRYVHAASGRMRSGGSSALERVVDGLINLNPLRNYLNGTALQDAIEAGKQSDESSCEREYPECQWPKPGNKMMKMFLEYLQRYLMKFV